MYSFRKYLPFYKRNLNVALPVMITQAGQVVVQLADNIMVGHVGTAQLAGVSFANAIFVIGLVTLIGFSQGLTPLVGEAFVKGDHSSVARYLKNSFTLNAGVYGLLMLILAGVGAMMPFMGQDADVLQYARLYYSINLFSLIPMMLFFTFRFFAEGVGNTKYAMWVTIASNILNIFLNWVLIFGHFGLPAMGVAGAALSTVISRLFCAVIFAAILLKAEAFRRYSREALRTPSDRGTTGVLLKLSLPIAFSSMLESMAFSLSAIMVGWMGKVQLAAHQVSMSLSQLSFLVATGIGAAATIRVSHQYGAGKRDETIMAGKAAIHMAIFYMGLCGLIFVILKDIIPGLYTNDREVVAVASRLIVVLAIYQIADAIQLASMSALRGLKDTRRPMLYAFVSYYIVAIPFGYLLGFTLGMGPEGVWCGLLLGLSVAAVLLYARFIRMSKRLFE